MAIPVIMPRQGQSVETCIISQWLKKKGDNIKKGDILFSYETDKAAFDLEAENEGILLEIFYENGSEVPVLTNVAVIGEKGENIESFRPGTAAPNKISNENKIEDLPKATPSASPKHADFSTKISPRAKKMATSLGIDIYTLTGTGPNGRIIVRDVENFNQQGTGYDTTITNSTADFEERKLSNVRKLISRAMHESISNSAQLTHHMSADVRKLLALRNSIKKEGKQDITLNDMICFAVINALKKHPEANSHFLGESVRVYNKVHLGLAVDTPRGLMVPALQNASDLSLVELSKQLKTLAEKCKKGNINPELLKGTSASFTVSNLGNYGVEMFTPIINLPQVAILGVNTILYRPADLGNGTFGFISVIGLSLTYDHRAIDGGPATLFLKEIKNEIENFNEIL